MRERLRIRVKKTKRNTIMKHKLPSKVIVLFCVMSMFFLNALGQGKNVTVTADHEPLTSVLSKIERQSGYFKLSYNASELAAFKVSADIKDKSAVEAVRSVTAGLPLTVNVDGKFIRVSAGKNVSNEQAAKKETSPSAVTGLVTDSEGEPLPGVTIRQKNGKILTVTDNDGNFKIRTDQDKLHLVFSYIGMKDSDVTAKKGHPVNVMMTSSSEGLDEVVVTGYKVIDKRASTSAITSIKAEDILRSDAISIDQMLEGKVPDLMYMSNSGEAGVTPKIRIRGTSSIIGNREPLWVVDGIVVNDPVSVSAEDLNDPDYVNRIGNAIAGLNPQDIERLDVLKDASATALYGTKAANGVIVITTKRGKEGKPQIRYSNTFTWKRRPRYTDRSVDVMNSKERIGMSKQLWDKHYKYDNLNMTMVGFEDAMYRYYKGLISKEQLDKEIATYETVNTDWFDLLTHDSFSQTHTVSISGGGDRASYYGSLGYTDSDDVVINTKNRRYNAMVNLDINFASWLTATFGIQGNVSDREYTQNGINPVEHAYKASRAIPAYNPDDPSELYFYERYGRSKFYGHRYNILNEIDNSWQKQDGNSVTFNMNLRFKIADWLTANGIFSYTNSNTNIEGYWSEKTWHGAELRDAEADETPGEHSVMPQGGEFSINQTRQKSWTARVQFNGYKYLCDDTHNIDVSIGLEANQNRYYGYSRVDRGYFPDRGMTFVSGINLDDYPEYKSWMMSNVPSLVDSKSNTLSGYLSASYNYDRLVFLNFNARVDGSNNFGDQTNNKLLPIWSISGSFDVSRIKRIREIDWIDRFTVKGSFGYQGNMLSDQTPVLIIKKGPFNSFYQEYTSTVSRNPNPDLKWEKTTSYNLGFDLGFLNNRLQIEGDLYWKHTKDAFMTKQISTINGYDSYIVNGGDIDNTGYSVAITGRPIQTRDWQWSISTVFSRSINKIKNNPAGETYELSDFLNGNAVVKGKSIGTFYSYKFLGLSPVDGGPMFDDYADRPDELVNLSKYDTYTRVLVATGNREPIMSGSLSTQVRWKRLHVNANFNYSLGAKTRLFGMYGAGTDNSVYAQQGAIKPENNLSRDYLHAWRKPGDEKYTNIPAIMGENEDAWWRYYRHWSQAWENAGVQPIADDAWTMYDYSDIRVVSSDYLTLASLRVSYELPVKWLQMIGFKRVEVTASGNNLFTICDKKLKGQTPTQGGFTTIQLSNRPSYSFGFNITF